MEGGAGGVPVTGYRGQCDSQRSDGKVGVAVQSSAKGMDAVCRRRAADPF